jgi:hypothetical protein
VVCLGICLCVIAFASASVSGAQHDAVLSCYAGVNVFGELGIQLVEGILWVYRLHAMEYTGLQSFLALPQWSLRLALPCVSYSHQLLACISAYVGGGGVLSCICIGSHTCLLVILAQVRSLFKLESAGLSSGLVRATVLSSSINNTTRCMGKELLAAPWRMMPRPRLRTCRVRSSRTHFSSALTITPNPMKRGCLSLCRRGFLFHLQVLYTSIRSLPALAAMAACT